MSNRHRYVFVPLPSTGATAAPRKVGEEYPGARGADKRGVSQLGGG